MLGTSHRDFEREQSTQLLSEAAQEEKQNSYRFRSFISKKQCPIFFTWASQGITYTLLNWLAPPGIQQACQQGVEAALNNSTGLSDCASRVMVIESVGGILLSSLAAPATVVYANYVASIAGKKLAQGEICKGLGLAALSAGVAGAACTLEFLAAQPFLQNSGTDMQFEHGYIFASTYPDPCKHSHGLPGVVHSSLNYASGAIAGLLTTFSFLGGIKQGLNERQQVQPLENVATDRPQFRNR